MASCVQRIEYEEGEVYAGEWDGEGRRHGKGCLTFTDGSKYKGQFSAGYFHVSFTASSCARWYRLVPV